MKLKNSKIKLLFSDKIYTEKLDGRDHLVVPVVACLEGVRNGVLVKGEELEMTDFLWANKPVYLNHPESRFGRDMYNNHHLGVIMGFEVKESDGKRGLTGEIWIDIQKMENLDNNTLKRIRNKEDVEVSIGYYALESEWTYGEYDDEYYYMIDYGIIPDHIAVLNDGIGACSVEDGCGTGRVLERKFASENKLGLTVNNKKVFEGDSDISPCEMFSMLKNEDNKKELVEETYFETKDGWENSPCDCLYFPHHFIQGDELVLSKKMVELAVDNDKIKNNPAALEHLNKHLKELGISEKPEKKNFVNKVVNKLKTNKDNKGDDMKVKKNKDGDQEKVVVTFDGMSDEDSMKALESIEKFGVEKTLGLIDSEKEKIAELKAEKEKLIADLVKKDFKEDGLINLPLETLKKLNEDKTEKNFGARGMEETDEKKGYAKRNRYNK